MKSLSSFLTTSLVVVFTILFVNISYSQNPVSGYVLYSDNLQPVTSGTVNAYRVSDQSLIATTNINSDGSYAFALLPGELIDIIGPANHEWGQGAIPTYYPNKIDWTQATQILPIVPLTNINIYATRVGTLGGTVHILASISGRVTMDNKALGEAIIYAKQGDSYRGYGISDSKGNFKINQVPVGDYILVVHRIGCTSSSTDIKLTADGLSNVNFSLDKAMKAQDNSVAHNFTLGQNYPNPFNPTTKIAYSIPKDGYVKLVVYDINGQLVKELVNENQQAGNYSISFDASNLASGVYFYTFSSGSFVQTKKLTLVK